MNTGELAIRGPRIGIFEPSRSRLEQLGLWFETEYPGLLRFAYFVSGDTAVAEDLVQDAFVRIYRAGGRVEREGFHTYARKTIVNLHRSRFRRAARERAVRPDEAVSSDTAAYALRDEMWNAIQTLSPRQRAVIALRFYEDLKERDVAAVLGMSVGSVKKHADRAMTKLREQLGNRRES
jgi:RNA polymerase sigma-70 factor (sigma-E family)